MRVALISIAGQPRDAAGRSATLLAGRSLARRQLDFALAAGAGRVVALGDGTDPEAIALRHAAEAAGARFQVIRDAHGLPGAVRPDDELLVLAPGLLPDSAEAPAMLADGAILTVPAALGVAAGFERIDLERAWAGALLAPGALAGRLGDLPTDSEPAAALLRLALQARVPERRLPAEPFASGAWAMLRDRDDLLPVAQEWLARNLPAAGRWSMTARLAHRLLHAFGTRLLSRQGTDPSLLAAFVVLLAAGVASAAYAVPAVGFAALAAAALAAELGTALARLRHAPFGNRVVRRLDLAALAAGLLDLALLACAALAIDHDALHRLFPPLVALGLLRALRPERWAHAGALLGDRGLLALGLAVACAARLAEPAIMALALVLIAFEGAKTLARSG